MTKKCVIILGLCLLLILTTACAAPDLPGEEYPSNGTLSDETEKRELESGEWPRKFSPSVSGTYELEVGQVIDWVYSSFSYEPDDEYISLDDYSVTLIAEDPEIVEIVSYDRDKLLSYSPGGAIVIKGLKTGTTRLKYSVIYNPTGGAYTSYATVTVVAPASTQPAETTGTLSDETEKRELESGEWPNVCSVDFASDFIYTFDYYFNVNETTSDFLLGFTFNPDHYQGKDDYKIDAFADDPSIVEIVLVDKDALMDFEPIGGLTIKCLKTGTTRIGVTMTYLPTGGTFTTYATVTVVDPAATQPAEATD